MNEILKKTIVWASASICLWLAGCSNQSGNEIRVGAVLPLSGDWALFGNRMLNGINLWIEDHPKARMRVYVEDGQGNVSRSISAFNKLVNLHHVSACLTGTSPVVLGLAPLSDAKKVFTVNIGAINPDIKKITPYMFTIVPDADVEARFVAGFIATNLNIRSCFVLWRNDESGLGMLNSFSQAYSEMGGMVIGNESVLEIDRVNDALLKLRNSGEKTVFIPVNGDFAARIIRQACNLGLSDVLWIGYAATETPELIHELSNLEVKLIFSTFAFNASHAISKKSEEFICRYRNAYGEDPSLYSATCYDAMELIYSSCEKRLSDDVNKPLDICKLVETRNEFAGVSGNLLIHGNYISSSMMLKTLKNGAFVPYQK